MSSVSITVCVIRTECVLGCRHVRLAGVGTYRNGKVYRQVGVRPSYRVGEKVETSDWANGSRPSVKTHEVVRTSLKGQKFLRLEGLQVGDRLDDGG
ncbi:hypothetical protein [Candidatus Methylacidithermus pantelleriae]|uniref:Uncharacterized protein n=1 Tax=Candidatus Methylacidithermus pantelleriae TaxID=2744239 RepID=A0A8J2FSD2_9BACT|nr:hypothetical protein [Candidatus Methylacidithermus pantelleriae]CAF0695770.1 hypothetical protein MPNT_20006 [Candidatus Methylacidithermus pantelleriae]